MNRFVFVMLALFLLLGAPALANAATKETVLQNFATAGDARAQYQLALLYEQRAGGTANSRFEPDPEHRKKARHWFEAAAAQEHPEARHALLSRIYDPDWNSEEAEKWLRLATPLAESGDRYAQFRLAEFYYGKCVGSRIYHGDPFAPAIRWYSTLLEGVASDDTVLFPEVSSLNGAVTVADVKWKLDYLKELTR